MDGGLHKACGCHIRCSISKIAERFLQAFSIHSGKDSWSRAQGLTQSNVDRSGLCVNVQEVDLITEQMRNLLSP